ncbi:MAG: hypothetical protein HY870_07115, partial [Chloroflexi bacterium]|nr:hypothetical protein [Chloroflexota bacterium]
MRKQHWLWLLIALDLLFIAAIWFDLTPLVRGPDEWRWSLRSTQVSPWLILIPCAMLLVYIRAASHWLKAFNRDKALRLRRFEFGLLAFLTLAAPLVQVVLAAAVWRSPLFEFFANTVSPSVTGFHSVAVTTPNLLDQLGHYSDFMSTLPIHPQ